MTLSDFAAKGVSLTLAPDGSLKAKWDKPISRKLVDALKAHKPVLVAELSQREPFVSERSLEPLLPHTDMSLNDLQSLYTYATWLLSTHHCLFVHTESLALTLWAKPLDGDLTTSATALVKARCLYPWGRIQTPELKYLCKWGAPLTLEDEREELGKAYREHRA